MASAPSSIYRSRSRSTGGGVATRHHTLLSPGRERESRAIVWVTASGYAKQISRRLDTGGSIRQGSQAVVGAARWANVASAIEDWKTHCAIGIEGPFPEAWVLDFFSHIVRLAEDELVSEPVPYFAADGEIGLRWRKDHLVASFSITKDGKLYSFLRVNRENPLRLNGFEAWLSHQYEFFSQLK